MTDICLPHFRLSIEGVSKARFDPFTPGAANDRPHEKHEYVGALVCRSPKPALYRKVTASPEASAARIPPPYTKETMWESGLTDRSPGMAFRIMN